MGICLILGGQKLARTVWMGWMEIYVTTSGVLIIITTELLRK